MVSHQFIEGHSKTNFVQNTMQIAVDSLAGNNLIKIINYLIEHIHVVYDKSIEQKEVTMWPIEIKLGDGSIMSESVFWKYVFETLTDAYEYLHRYTKKLCELAQTTEYHNLLQSNEYQHHGGMAINQYWL